MHIESLTPERFAECRDQLADLLVDVVEGGASVNFVMPFNKADSLRYWSKLDESLASGERIMLAAWEGDTLVGSVQLALATQPNGVHRAEVQKLLVHRSARGRGYGKALMAAIEQAAKDCGRSLLVLDTESGSIAEGLYEKIGWVRAGGIPNFAMNTTGELRANVIFYRNVG